MNDTEKAGAEAKTAGHTDDEGNISFAEAVQSRLDQQIEPDEPEAEASPEPEADEKESPAEEQGEDAETDDLPVDLESLSADELEALKSKLTPGAVKRIGKLTAQKKAAQDEIARLKAQIESKPAFAEPETPETNPYSDLDTEEALNEKYGETTKFIEDFRVILDENEDALSDDEIFEEDGKGWTKKQVKAALRNAEKAKEKFLPARLQELRKLEALGQQTQQFRAQAEKEVEWMADEESDLRKEWDSYMGSPVVQRAIKAVPEIGPLMPYMIAHAINSSKGQKTAIKAPAKPKLTPTSAVKSSAAPSVVSGDQAKLISELEARFEDSGSAHDAAKLRLARMK